MTRRPDPTPVPVPTAQHTGEIRTRWRWVEPGVWTERMLATPEHGVEGGKWFRLFDKVFSERNLLAAFQQVAQKKGAPGVDHVTIERFQRQLPDQLSDLSERLRSHTFRPQAIRRVHIPKPGSNETRPLGIPTVRDRVVQAAIVNVIEPIFECHFAEQSHGFRPGRGCKDALRHVDELLKAGYTHVVDADLKSYFDTIPHDRLMDRLSERISDGSVLGLIKKFLTADILDAVTGWTPTAGAPQGAVLSPLLSNVYLNSLDHLLADSGFQMVRYADDFVILCRSPEEAQAALELVRKWVAENGLTLHPEKTRVVDAQTEGFDFLGYTFRDGQRWPRAKSLTKMKTTLRQKTRRTSGKSLESMIADVNRTLRGWFAYFQHSHRYTFDPLDRFVRQRLRAILRKRSHRRGIAKGGDFRRWPNAFFAEAGLFSLAAAHAKARQSSRR